MCESIIDSYRHSPIQMIIIEHQAPNELNKHEFLSTFFQFRSDFFQNSIWRKFSRNKSS